MDNFWPMINSDNLYDWLFHYNHYTELWNAFQRKNYLAYFNNPNNPDVVILKSKKFETLEEIIVKMNGDVDRIENL